jgi:signal transduction histidine kinase
VSAVFDVVEGVSVFRIQDSGIGIPSQDLSHIFERFYRADKTRTRKDDGFGLGLAIAKWIADAHTAHIDVESVSGHGSVFTVRFPRASLGTAQLASGRVTVFQ